MKLIKRLSGVDFIRFCMVGGLGFLINYALLSLFYKKIGLPIFLSQLLASEIALFHNFMLHHHWTYRKNSRDSAKSLKKYIVEFHVTSWVAIVGSALLVTLCVRVLRLSYDVSLVISSLVALLWNFAWTKYFVWSDQSSKIVRS